MQVGVVYFASYSLLILDFRISGTIQRHILTYEVGEGGRAAWVEPKVFKACGNCGFVLAKIRVIDSQVAPRFIVAGISLCPSLKRLDCFLQFPSDEQIVVRGDAKLFSLTDFVA